MQEKRYQQLRVAVSLFVGAIIGFSVMRDSFIMATIGVMTGMLFLAAAHAKTNIRTDERERQVRMKAAQMTYAIFAPTIAIGAFLLLIPSKSGFSVFSKGDFVYLESLGMVFAYLALFMIALYAISYHFINRQYGGSDCEK